MTYPEYIAQIDAAWLAAQHREDVAETQILAAILYRLVQPPSAAITFLIDLAEKTTDPALRARYEQASADIQSCEEEPMPKRSPEKEVMRADGPVSAEDLAQLAYTLYQQTAPHYGLSPENTPWEGLSEAQQQCAIAVARRLLHRVESRMRYILHGGYTGPLLSEESEKTDAVR